MATPPDPVDELYAVPPGTFIAARDAAVAAARAQGDKELTARLKALRRPTPGAWMVNALVRDDRGVIEDFLSLGAALAQAQSALQGEELRALSAQRSQLVTSLVARGEALAAAAGVRMDSAAAGEAHDTLVAALVDTRAAADVRAGRLVRGLRYSGFGVEPDASVRPVPVKRVAPPVDGLAAAKARAVLEKALGELTAAEQAESAAVQAQAELDEKLSRARAHLRHLERRAAEAALEARAAAGAARRAKAAADVAERAQGQALGPR